MTLPIELIMLIGSFTSCIDALLALEKLFGIPKVRHKIRTMNLRLCLLEECRNGNMTLWYPWYYGPYYSTAYHQSCRFISGKRILSYRRIYRGSMDVYEWHQQDDGTWAPFYGPFWVG